MQALPSSFVIFLVRMSDNIIDLVSNSKVEISSSSAMGIFHDFPHLSFSSDHLRLEVIPIFDDYGLDRVFGNSSEIDISSSMSLDALILNVCGRMSRTKVPMPHLVLSEEEVRANLKRKEHARGFIQVCVQTKAYNPRDIDVL